MDSPSTVLQQHNVRQFGRPDGPALLFAHGFGCDQRMWRHVVPAFTDRYRVILFDYVGAGEATRPYRVERYDRLEGYAEDVNEILEALDLRQVTFIGHSVSAMIGMLAARLAPDRYARSVMVCPSPSYTIDGDYDGGFTVADIDELLQNLDRNYLGWSQQMTPVIMGAENGADLVDELTNSFCRMDPDIASRFASVTFRSDCRSDLPRHTIPTLVIQCRDDFIAPPRVGEYVAEQLPQGQLIYLDATGHCPNLSAPEQTSQAIDQFLANVPLPHDRVATG